MAYSVISSTMRFSDGTICRISSGAQLPEDEPDYVDELRIEEARAEDRGDREREERD